MYNALAAFGAPLREIRPEEFAEAKNFCDDLRRPMRLVHAGDDHVGNDFVGP